MLKYQLQSGVKVEMNLASIEPALVLYRAVVQECKGAGLDITGATTSTIGELLIKNIDALLNIISSEAVLEAIKGCCDKVIYNGQHFSMELFEDEKAKGDFFGLMLLVASENLRPFFPNLASLFTTLSGMSIKSSIRE
jgi:hypothetical protein